VIEPVARQVGQYNAERHAFVEAIEGDWCDAEGGWVPVWIGDQPEVVKALMTAWDEKEAERLRSKQLADKWRAEADRNYEQALRLKGLRGSLSHRSAMVMRTLADELESPESTEETTE
jgi:hypothetical protein